MSDRLKLHEELVSVLGSRNVYFQPPESVKIKYPCIIYERDSADIKFANDKPYKNVFRYTVTVIEKDPDGLFIEKLLGHFHMCRYDRHYTADNLNHDVFTLYY